MIPYGTQVPVALRHNINCYTQLLYLLHFMTAITTTSAFFSELFNGEQSSA